MSDKYIIRNCPAFYPLMDRNECMGNDGQCQDCTDCVLKRLHQEITEELNCAYCNNMDGFTLLDDCEKVCKHPHLYKLLDMLDIQEVE